MLTRGSVTIYHLTGLDKTTRLEVWQRYNYSKAWYFEDESASINNGYNNTDKVQIRLPYSENTSLDFSNFAKGDIIVIGTLEIDIQTQEDLKGYKIYNINSLKNDDIGLRPHIHLGGK